MLRDIEQRICRRKVKWRKKWKIIIITIKGSNREERNGSGMPQTITGIERSRGCCIREFSIAFIHCQRRDRWIVIHSSQVKRSMCQYRSTPQSVLPQTHPRRSLRHRLRDSFTNISRGFHAYNLQTFLFPLSSARFTLSIAYISIHTLNHRRSIIILEI